MFHKIFRNKVFKVHSCVMNVILFCCFFRELCRYRRVSFHFNSFQRYSLFELIPPLEDSLNTKYIGNKISRYLVRKRFVKGYDDMIALCYF